MNLSIVIPVYNEADRLRACLEAIATQIDDIYEVIVVDNNSSDSSALIAESFDFVTLLREPKQGVVHARNKGFDLAKGEIIGRIDADTILPKTWAKKVKEIFSKNEIAAVSGSANYYDFALQSLADSVDAKIRYKLSKRLGNENFLWGANMAIKRSIWLKVRSEVCSKANIHEDFDLAIHIQQKGLEVLYSPDLLANVSSRRVDTGFMDYAKYSLVSPKTYASHGLKSQKNMYPVLVFCWMIYLPARIIYRIYDAETDTYRFRRIFSSNQSRVDPTTNIA